MRAGKGSELVSPRMVVELFGKMAGRKSWSDAQSSGTVEVDRFALTFVLTRSVQICIDHGRRFGFEGNESYIMHGPWDTRKSWSFWVVFGIVVRPIEIDRLTWRNLYTSHRFS